MPDQPSNEEVERYLREQLGKEPTQAQKDAMTKKAKDILRQVKREQKDGKK